MRNTWDVIVIGLGAMGSAALWQLSRRGARVLGIEQGSIGHALGSSHGGSRIFRMAYFEHPDYVPLLRRAARGWSEIERASQTRLMNQCGLLYGGMTGSKVIAGVKDSARMYGIALDVVNRRDLGERFPVFAHSCEPMSEYLFEPGAGFVRPERSIRSFVRVAQRSGAHVRERTRVDHWEESGERVEVHAGGVVETTKQLVICAGPWMAHCAPQFAAPVVNTRQVIGWVSSHDPVSAASYQMPAFFMEREAGEPLYGIPTAHDQDPPYGVKIGIHGDGSVCDPDSIDRRVHAHETQELEAIMQRVAPGAAGPVTASAVCMYTNTPDGDFVIDRVPQSHRVTVAGGFCGHGFKFAPVIGELLAEIALAGSTTLPTGFLKRDRFDRA